jgi:Nif-specific regulatory protein
MVRSQGARGSCGPQSRPGNPDCGDRAESSGPHPRARSALAQQALPRRGPASWIHGFHSFPQLADSIAMKPEPTPNDKKLMSLLNASLLLNSTLSIRDVLHTLSLHATQHTGADRTTLYLVSDDSRELVSEIAQGDGISSVRVKLGVGIAGHVAAHGAPLIVPDAYEDSRFDRATDQRTGYRTRSLLAVPIKDRRGKVIGVLQALNKGGAEQPATFDDADVAYLATLASHAAVAIQNARVYAELARERNELQAENSRLRRRASAKPSEPVGSSPPFLDALETARAVAGSTANVLLRGESGTGKGIFAKLIHQLSPRMRGPLVQINCSAIPHDLIESELFGIERGVATGVEARKGRMEMANSGTCFLDEIGDMSAQAQTKILRVIEDRELERVGGRVTIPLDVRLVAATHQDLEALMDHKRFRADLYYRLNVVTIWLPPLRDRGTDVIDLARFFVKSFGESNGKPRLRLAGETLDLLLAYTWPGNVRELENVVERAVVLCRGDVIEPSALPAEIRGDAPSAPARDAVEEVPPSTGGDGQPGRGERPRMAQGKQQDAVPDLRDSLDQYEKALIRRALRGVDGNQMAAARSLGISESNLRYKMKKHGLTR